MRAGDRIRRVLREPTLHFALLAALLFGASGLFGGDDGRRVEISPAELEVRILQAQAARRSPLTPEDRDAVLESLIEERILVREARALGLEEDARIHDILVQKMLHVLSRDVIQPSEAELRDFYRENEQRYLPPPAVTVEERILPVGSDPDAAAPPARVTTLSRITRSDLAGIFGPVMADSLFAVTDSMAVGVDRWVGPHETVRGWHWLRVVERHPPVAPSFEEIREPLRLDWIREEEEARLEARVDELRSRYEVVVREAEGASE